MNKPITDFFLQLPPKSCTVCDHELEEMADCYSTVCNECNGTVFYPLSPIAVVLT